MARPGITFYEVANAAAQLEAQGIYPTIEGVRRLTGTGSSTTIATHLKLWRNQQNETKNLKQEGIPDTLQAVIKGLWFNLMEEAGNKVHTIQADFEQRLTTLSESYHQIENELQSLKNTHDIILKEKNNLLNEKEALQILLNDQQETQRHLQNEKDKLNDQLQEKNNRIEDLQRLHKQVQDNLEHYREAAREQRIQDQEQFHYMQSMLETRLFQASENAKKLEEFIQQLQTEIKFLQHQKQNLQEQHDVLLAAQETKQTQLEAVKTDLQKSLHAYEYVQSNHENLQQQFNQQKTAHLNLVEEISILREKINQAQKENEQLMQQNELLMHDKWQLGQTAAELRGEIKQYQLLVDRKAV